MTEREPGPWLEVPVGKLLGKTTPELTAMSSSARLRKGKRVKKQGGTVRKHP